MPRKPAPTPAAVREFETVLADIHTEFSTTPAQCDQHMGLGWCPQQMPNPPHVGHTSCYYHRKIRSGLFQPVIRPYSNTKARAA